MTDTKIFELGGTHPTIYHPFVSALLPDLKKKTIVDMGCGRGVWGFLIRTQRDLTKSTFIGVDYNAFYLKFVNHHKIYDKTVRADITKKLPFKDASVDFLICSEVIEHLTKKQGESLLKEIDRIMKPGSRAIVTTPNVWLNMPYNNPLDRHYSLWNKDDFSKRGYMVRGIGAKLPFNKTTWYTPLIHAAYYFMTPFSYVFPQLSGLLVSVKDYSVRSYE